MDGRLQRRLSGLDDADHVTGGLEQDPHHLAPILVVLDEEHSTAPVPMTRIRGGPGCVTTSGGVHARKPHDERASSPRPVAASHHAAAVLLVATMRPDPASEAAPFRVRALADFAHRTTELRLGPLADDDATALARSLSRNTLDDETVASAVARRRQGRTLSSKEASSILHRFRQHLAGRYTVIEITPALFHEAMRLANTHALRAYDAVQLAAAIEINQKEQDAGFAPMTLISADQALNDAAAAEGLLVENPNVDPESL